MSNLERAYTSMTQKSRPSWKSSPRLQYQKLRASLAWPNIVPSLSQTSHQWWIRCGCWPIAIRFGSWPMVTSPSSGIVSNRKPLTMLRRWSQKPLLWYIIDTTRSVNEAHHRCITCWARRSVGSIENPMVITGRFATPAVVRHQWNVRMRSSRKKS